RSAASVPGLDRSAVKGAGSVERSPSTVSPAKTLVSPSIMPAPTAESSLLRNTQEQGEFPRYLRGHPRHQAQRPCLLTNTERLASAAEICSLPLPAPFAPVTKLAGLTATGCINTASVMEETDYEERLSRL